MSVTAAETAASSQTLSTWERRPLDDEVTAIEDQPINVAAGSVNVQAVQLTSGRHRIARRYAQLQLRVLVIQPGDLSGAAQQQSAGGAVLLLSVPGAVDQIQDAAVAEVRGQYAVPAEVCALQVQPQADARRNQAVGGLVVVRFGAVDLQEGRTNTTAR